MPCIIVTLIYTKVDAHVDGSAVLGPPTEFKSRRRLTLGTSAHLGMQGTHLVRYTNTRTRARTHTCHARTLQRMLLGMGVGMGVGMCMG